jgi:hypothetical protein
MYVKRKIEMRSCSHCCSGKVMNITWYVCVFIALGSQQAMRMRQIVICGMSGSTAFFHIISQTARFFWGKKVTENKMCVLIFSEKNLYLKHFSF